MPFSEKRLQDHMALYGYQMMETPIVDSAWLFLAKAGDQIIDRLFTMQRGGRELALRPEFTAAAAYMYTCQTEPVVRWQFNGPVFEDAPETPNGVRQKHNMGAELIGLAGSVADAEIIGIAAAGLHTIDLSTIHIIIGHVGLMRLLLRQFALDERSLRFLLNHRTVLKSQGKQAVIERLDHYLKIRTIPDAHSDGEVSASTEQMLGALLTRGNPTTTLGGRTHEDIARRLLQKQQRAAQRDQIIAACDFLETWGKIQAAPESAFDQIKAHIEGQPSAEALVNEWETTILALSSYGISIDHITLQPDLARSWDYYTGVVFELRTQEGLLVGGGGRYDELVTLVGGVQNTPAVGFAYYADALRQLEQDTLTG